MAVKLFDINKSNSKESSKLLFKCQSIKYSYLATNGNIRKDNFFLGHRT